MRKFKYNDPNTINPIDKICYKCHERKQLNEFNKCKTGVYGYHNHCRKCSKRTKKEWNIRNSDWIKKYSQQPEVIETRRKWYKERYDNDLEFREKELKKNRERRRLESAKIKARAQRNKWMEIPHNKIAQSLRGRIRIALKGISKIDSTENLVGCSFLQLKSYLESKFQSEMTWDNYGEWEIDHIKPCASFDLTDPEQQKECFHYTNLQPLWGEDNRSKGDKII